MLTSSTGRSRSRCLALKEGVDDDRPPCRFSWMPARRRRVVRVNPSPARDYCVGDVGSADELRVEVVLMTLVTVQRREVTMWQQDGGLGNNPYLPKSSGWNL